MDKEKILIKHLKSMLKRTKQSYVTVEQMKETPEYKAVLNAMTEMETELLKNSTLLPDIEGGLPTRKVCFFTLKNGKYLTENNIEITTDMLVKYNHQITDSWSYIIID